MTYNEFLNQAIAGGIAGAKADYTRPDQQLMLEGALQGFEACRAKTPSELGDLYAASAKRTTESLEDPEYWKHQCFFSEVQWICNVVSALLVAERLSPIIPTTARGVLRAQEILSGSGSHGELQTT